MQTAKPRARHDRVSDHSRCAQRGGGTADGARAPHQRADDRPRHPAADRPRHQRRGDRPRLSVLLLEGGGRADRTAIAGLDVACWDASAIAAGIPLVRMLGGVPKPVPAYNSNGLGLMAPEAAADEAEALLEGGFRAIKLRLGYPSLDADLAAVRAVRRRVPGNILLMVDFNQALTVAEAIRRGLALEGEGIYWIEEPIRHDDYPGNAEVAAALATPVQIGENFSGPQAMAAALGAKACDYVMPDLERIGGVSGWQQAAALAAAAGIERSSHLFPEISSHLLAAAPTAHWLEYVDWDNPILREPVRIVDGAAVVPDRTGSGLEWDEDAVERYRIE